MGSGTIASASVQGSGPVFRIREFVRKNGVGYLFMLPFLLLFAVFTVVPVGTAFGLSFSYFNMLEAPSFVGLDNFKLLVMDDDIFALALRNTLLFSVVIGPVGFSASFLFAWVINSLRFRNLYALAFYTPSITSGIAMSVVWLYFFSNDRYGLINDVLISLGFLTEPVLWTLDARTILPVVIFISAWMSMGTGFLVFLAGLQNIPKELLEAARIDGVRSGFQELWHIILPLMKPQLLFNAISTIVASFAVFDIAVSVAGIPSPNYAAHTIVAHLYDYAFIRFQMGYASAIAVVLFLMTFILGRISMRLFAERD